MSYITCPSYKSSPPYSCASSARRRRPAGRNTQSTNRKVCAMGVFRSHSARPLWLYDLFGYYCFCECSLQCSFLFAPLSCTCDRSLPGRCCMYFWRHHIWRQITSFVITPLKSVAFRGVFREKVPAISTFPRLVAVVDGFILWRTFSHSVRPQRAPFYRTQSHFFLLATAAVETFCSDRFHRCNAPHALSSLLYISCLTFMSRSVS